MIQSLSFPFLPLLLAPVGCLALMLPVPASGDDQEDARKQTEQLVMQLVEDSQKHKVERVLVGDDALHQAELACVLLASDVSSYTEHLGEVQAACLKAGRLEDALLLAAKMRELGNEAGLTQIMLAHAHAGRVQEAMAAREELRKHLPRLTTHRRQRAERDMVLTTGLIGEGEADVSLLKELLPEDSLEVEAEWIQVGKRKAPQTEVAVLGRIKKTPVSPLAGGRYAIACADHMLGNKNAHAEGIKVVDLAGKICVETPHVTAHRLLIDLARCARGHGLVEAGNKAMSLFLKACAGYSTKSEWKAGYLAEAAVLLHEWKEDELALKAMSDAREALKEVFVADVARELLATARAAHTLGQKPERDQAALDALRSASVHPHPRVRGDAAVAACLFYASLNESIPQPVREALRKVHEGAPATP
jgi:hypothetical protein